MGQLISDSLAERLVDIERRLHILEAAPQLTSSSIKEGVLRILDNTGTVKVELGKLSIGGYGLSIDEGRVRAIDVSNIQGAGTTFTNASIDTTPFVVASGTLTKPAWATQALVVVLFAGQVSNSSGSAYNMHVDARIDGGTGGSRATTIQNGETTAFFTNAQAVMTDLTGDVSVDGRLSLNTGTNSSNNGNLAAYAFWML